MNLLNMLATLKQELGELGRVRQTVKLFGMVNCTEDFDRLPAVITGASDLFVEVLGEAGSHARSAVGMQQLHYGMAIEIEGQLEVADSLRAADSPSRDANDGDLVPPLGTR
jgi:enamine deaminase RidA (YjgF/YER057c/UK114 family)